jgi:hypothetical protein
MKIKSFIITTRALCSLVIILIVTGCHSTHQEPDYQGRSGAVPKIQDYYPDKSKQSPNDPLKPGSKP